MRWAYTNLETFPYPPDLHIIAYNHLCLPLHLNVFDCAQMEGKSFQSRSADIVFPHKLHNP